MRSPGTLENEVLFGLQDTLFLGGGAHGVMEIATAGRIVPEASFQVFEANIRGRADWAQRRGLGYLHLIFPDKQSIVPDRWPLGPPVRLGQQCVDRVPTTLPLSYPVSLLSAASSDVVSAVDTHVTDHGSIIVAGHVVERLTGVAQDERVGQLLATITGTKSQSGDLGSKLTPPITVEERCSTVKAPGRWLTNGLEGGNNGLVDLRFCDHPAFDKRLLIFGDSFGRDLARFLHFWFREVIFFRTPFFDPDLAGLVRPDYVLTENVERYLDDCHPDDERPSFFMYPHLKPVQYAPSPDFARVFSAILSVPRPPYLEFRRSEFGEDASHTRSDAAAQPLPIPDARGFAGLIRLQPRESPPSDLAVIEPVRLVARHMPEFVDNQSGADIPPWLSAQQDIHGTFLAKRTDVVLFGPSIQVDAEGAWSSESRAFAEQFVDMVNSEGYCHHFPGPKPRIAKLDHGYELNFESVHDRMDVLDGPMFLATPLEPDNWGRWISSVVPKILDYRKFGDGRKLLCHDRLGWQRSLLEKLGVKRSDIVSHDPGRTYLCRDLMCVEHSVTNMTVSDRDRVAFDAIRDRIQAAPLSRNAQVPKGAKIFVSRRSTSLRHPDYRVLQNEVALAHRLRSMGFEVIEPEMLSFEEQVLAFSNARVVVCLGGAALYNAVFCNPDVLFVTLESSGYFLRPHCDLLSSLRLRYGVVIGRQDSADPVPVHKRWTVDVGALVQRLQPLI